MNDYFVVNNKPLEAIYDVIDFLGFFMIVIIILGVVSWIISRLYKMGIVLFDTFLSPFKTLFGGKKRKTSLSKERIDRKPKYKQEDVEISGYLKENTLKTFEEFKKENKLD